MTAALKKELDAAVVPEVQYCIPIWLRDEQIKLALERNVGRIQPVDTLRKEPIAIVCFGPSLNDTWEQIRSYRFIMSCSGSHKFLLERGIVPTWHVEVDPRPHKIELIGPPHKDVEYLIASTCHPKVFDHLEGHTVKLWHVYANEQEAHRLLPRGEWALTGGSNVGLRALTIARFLGFRDLQIFGMDGSEGPTGKHAATHPNQPLARQSVKYKGVTYSTTAGMLACAQGTFHELNQMPDVKATFHGEGLVQHMSRHYVRKPPTGEPLLAFNKPELISADYARQNEQLHRENLAYGVGGGKHAPVVLRLAEGLKTRSILDYGAGKGYLAKEIPFPIWEYDPAVPGKQESPRPADLVVCTDVLEHIEPDRLTLVLDDLRRCTLKVGFFVIHQGPAGKTLPDGRNTHLIQKGELWWKQKLERFFTIGRIFKQGPALTIVVAPKKRPEAAAAQGVTDGHGPHRKTRDQAQGPARSDRAAGSGRHAHRHQKGRRDRSHQEPRGRARAAQEVVVVHPKP